MKQIDGDVHDGSAAEEHESHIRDYLIIGGTACLLAVYWSGWDIAVGGVDIALLAALLSGFPIVKEAVAAIIQRGDTKVGLLVSIAIIASIAIGEYVAAAEVALIMTIGEFLEHMTLERSNTALRKLADLTPLKARILDGDEEREVAAETVRVGDRLLVKTGEKIPVDGVVLTGYATVDQSAITGESIPVERREGDTVYGGTLAQMGYIEMVATKVGQDTALGHIIQMVAQAQASKAPVARMIDRWANWFIPLSLAIALLVYIITGDIVRGVTILIVFCPCAMLLSTPTAVAAAIGAAARRGILIKGGEVLEKIGQINTILFDKTGTLTVGQPELKEIHCYGAWQRHKILALAAGIEKRSEHHLAKAIIRRAVTENVAMEEPSHWEQIVGQGIIAHFHDHRFLLGNKTLMVNHDVIITQVQDQAALEQQTNGGTVVFVATDDELAAILVINDPLREGAAHSVAELKRIGVENTVLLTGDAKVVGKAVGAQLGISVVHGDLLPDDKVAYVETYQREGRLVAMVGDGINDAPALAKAHVGIAMGCGGTDVAVEAADIALLSDDLGKIAEVIHLSRRAVRTIQQNIITANMINILAIGFAAYGLLGPVAAAVIHNAGAILVVLNSARLLKYPGYQH
jgi:Zn2+/Cd2+-exporting ATPase